jgi:hypothetical protein
MSALKIVRQEFPTLVENFGGVNFDRHQWKRMTTDYRIRECHLKRFLSRLWKGDVLRVSQYSDCKPECHFQANLGGHEVGGVQ